MFLLVKQAAVSDLVYGESLVESCQSIAPDSIVHRYVYIAERRVWGEGVRASTLFVTTLFVTMIRL